MYLKFIEPQNLIFNAPEGNIHNYYYNINESLEILDDLLKYQFFNDSEQITNFLTILYNVINKHIPKKILYLYYLHQTLEKIFSLTFLFIFA